MNITKIGKISTFLYLKQQKRGQGTLIEGEDSVPMTSILMYFVL